MAKVHQILLLVGDDLNDFVTGIRAAGITPERRREVAEWHAVYWGRQWIVMPNPMCGSWESALYGGEKLDCAEKIRRGPSGSTGIEVPHA